MKNLFLIFTLTLSGQLFAQDWKVVEFSLFDGDFIAAEVLGSYQTTDNAIDLSDDPLPRIHIRVNKLDGDIGVVIGLVGLKKDYWYKEAECQLRYYGSSLKHDYLLEYIINDIKGLFWFQSPLNEYKSIRYDKYTMPLVYSLMENKEVYLNIKLDSHNIQCKFNLTGSAEAINKLLKYRKNNE